MPVEIRAPEESSYDDLVRLRMERVPAVRRVQAEWVLRHGAEMEIHHLRAAYDDGVLLGWGNATRGDWFPPRLAVVAVTVARGHERSGTGTALARALVDALPPTIERLGTFVQDDDAASLEYAEHRGFTVTQHGIESEMPLVDLPEPNSVPGVTVEDVSGLEFADEDAVEAMLVDSQTNPEAAEGFLTRLSTFRELGATAERRIAVLARVDGVPAAIVVGEVNDGILGIAYTGVRRAFRGRGLGFLLKQHAHRLAAAGGATVTRTMNEAGNTGIRHVNAKLGYRKVYGSYRLRADRSDLRW
jgi:GNAT superfamily N-acetyltransferase